MQVQENSCLTINQNKLKIETGSSKRDLKEIYTKIRVISPTPHCTGPIGFPGPTGPTNAIGPTGHIDPTALVPLATLHRSPRPNPPHQRSSSLQQSLQTIAPAPFNLILAQMTGDYIFFGCK
jgi:hypothetical protein